MEEPVITEPHLSDTEEPEETLSDTEEPMVTEPEPEETEELITEPELDSTSPADPVAEPSTCLKSCIDVSVARFELYPRENPSSYCVGFQIKCKPNGRSNYIDTTVSLEDAAQVDHSDTAICKLAFEKLKSGIVQHSQEMLQHSALLGTSINDLVEF